MIYCDTEEEAKRAAQTASLFDQDQSYYVFKRKGWGWIVYEFTEDWHEAQIQQNHHRYVRGIKN